MSEEKKDDVIYELSDKDADIYSRILAYERYEDVSSSKIAGEANVSVQKVNAFRGNLLYENKVWEALKQRFGFQEGQKPEWVGTGPQRKAAEIAAKQAAINADLAAKKSASISANVPATDSVKKAVAGPKSIKSGLVSIGPRGWGDKVREAVKTTAGGGGAGAAADALAAYEQEGPSIETLGTDMRQRWMKANNVVDMGGQLMQQIETEEGEVVYKPVQVPRTILAAEQRGSSEISQMMMNQLDGTVQALIRKTAFSPTAFSYFQWSKGKGYLTEEEDFADFVNMCINITMEKIFGAKIAVIVDSKNSLLGRLQQPLPNLRVEDIER